MKVELARHEPILSSHTCSNYEKEGGFKGLFKEPSMEQIGGQTLKEVKAEAEWPGWQIATAIIKIANTSLSDEGNNTTVTKALSVSLDQAQLPVFSYSPAQCGIPMSKYLNPYVN